MPQKYEYPKHSRLASWWLRWEDLNWPSPDVHDKIKRRAEMMAEGNVTAAMLFGTHFRWDYLPYFTLLHDYIATVAEELHARGVQLYDHHSTNLIHRYDTREEMRHVMLHSGPHLPFSPSREAAASWEYKGKRLNDWRMIDVRDGSVLYFPQYASEGFCHLNPEYVEAYCDYARTLVAETGIDGLSADDIAQLMHFKSCGCPYCRAELQRRAGIDLPPVTDTSFWGNWDNPAWRHWIDLRYDTATEFFKKLSAALPEGFRITTCGINSAGPGANSAGFEYRGILPYSNYVNQEMSGNTPPYKHDPVTVNVPVPTRLVNSSHHQAVAREFGVRAFSTGFGFTEVAANMVWAVNKILDLDCWFCTLKDRLGLPEHILKTLPDDPEVIGRAFTYEAEHLPLFDGEHIGQLGVYFSYETHRHTFFGSLNRGYYGDYSATLKLLFGAGISAHTVFAFPKDTSVYPVILVPSAAAMTEGDIAALRAYLAAGGRVIVCGPSPLPACENSWKLPVKPELSDDAPFFDSLRDGVWTKSAEWITKTKLPLCEEPNEWREAAPGLYYNPHRVFDGGIDESLLALCRQYMRPMPVAVKEAEGYLITMFERDDAILVHLLAADYDTDIDHHLDEIRFHRSRVNLVNKVTPIGIGRELRFRCAGAPEVFTPFSDKASEIVCEDGECVVRLPEKTAYAILCFGKEKN